LTNAGFYSQCPKSFKFVPAVVSLLSPAKVSFVIGVRDDDGDVVERSDDVLPLYDVDDPANKDEWPERVDKEPAVRAVEYLNVLFNRCLRNSA